MDRSDLRDAMQRGRSGISLRSLGLFADERDKDSSRHRQAGDRPLVKHSTHFHRLLRSTVGAGEVVVMSDKILDRPAMLLTLIAGLLFVLWIIAGYGPEGISAESVAQQHAARVQ